MTGGGARWAGRSTGVGQTPGLSAPASWRPLGLEGSSWPLALVLALGTLQGPLESTELQTSQPPNPSKPSGGGPAPGPLGPAPAPRDASKFRHPPRRGKGGWRAGAGSMPSQRPSESGRPSGRTRRCVRGRVIRISAASAGGRWAPKLQHSRPPPHGGGAPMRHECWTEVGVVPGRTEEGKAVSGRRGSCTRPFGCGGHPILRAPPSPLTSASQHGVAR